MDNKPTNNTSTMIAEMFQNFIMDPNYSEYRKLTLAMIVFIVLAGLLLPGN